MQRSSIFQAKMWSHYKSSSCDLGRIALGSVVMHRKDFIENSLIVTKNRRTITKNWRQKPASLGSAGGNDPYKPNLPR